MIEENNIINKDISELNKRLGVVISLLLRMTPSDRPSRSLKEQVGILDDLGIRPRDIAEILGRTQPHINKELVGLRREKHKKHEQK
ncbi:MAG: hypothetical protein PHT44_01880 [Candidatus Portnoybacteria bacterium]|nr:hypothetical protein [Candidatus Portnoybacteria bacterium]MDD4982657.1 hypothetical protein [Candidatus Portnoybacteria bacterium]